MTVPLSSQPPEWSDWHARLHQTLRSRQLLPAGESILIAVSGGQDSLCLLQLLQDLQPKWNWQLAVVHCDHQWRTDSTANADHVAAWVQERGLRLYREMATEPLLSEAAARQWRYQVFAEVAAQWGAAKIVTGHTASDRAETLLYNLMRGSGMDGLQALTWVRSLNAQCQVVRPLLDMTRAETGHICQHYQLPVWEDTTNQDFSYARNRIRLEVLPYLTNHFNPKLTEHLAQTAELLTADVAYLETAAAEILQQVQHPHAAALHCQPLQPLAIALQRRVLRQFLSRHLPRQPNFAEIAKTQALLTAPNKSRTDPFPGGAIAEREGHWLWLKQPGTESVIR